MPSQGGGGRGGDTDLRRKTCEIPVSTNASLARLTSRRSMSLLAVSSGCSAWRGGRPPKGLMESSRLPILVCNGGGWWGQTGGAEGEQGVTDLVFVLEKVGVQSLQKSMFGECSRQPNKVLHHR